MGRAGEAVADVPLELIGQAGDQPRRRPAAEAGALLNPVVEAVAFEELKVDRAGGREGREQAAEQNDNLFIQRFLRKRGR